MEWLVTNTTGYKWIIFTVVLSPAYNESLTNHLLAKYILPQNMVRNA